MEVDGQKLRRARLAKGFSQAELATASRISRRTIQRAEAEGRMSPRALRRVLGVLGNTSSLHLFVAAEGTRPANATGGSAADAARADVRRLEAFWEAHPTRVTVAMELAKAHLAVASGDLARHAQRAVDLLTLTIAATPVNTHEWAAAQHLLGVAWFRHPNPGRADRLVLARQAFEAALAAWSREAQPLEWAATANNLAVLLAQSFDPDLRRQAIDRFNDVLTVRTRNACPPEWAVTMRNLGNCWLHLRDVTRDRRVTCLSEAAAAYTQAMEVHTVRDHRVEWARLAYSVADVRREQAALAPENAQALIENGLALCRDAIAALTREDGPDWANAHFNLAELYRSNPGATVGNLQEAIEAYVKVLAVYPRRESETEWANTHLPLGLAYERLAAFPEQDRRDLIARAVAHVKAARTVFTVDEANVDVFGEHVSYSNTLERLRKAYLTVRAAADPVFDDILPAD